MTTDTGQLVCVVVTEHGQLKAESVLSARDFVSGPQQRRADGASIVPGRYPQRLYWTLNRYAGLRLVVLL